MCMCVVCILVCITKTYNYIIAWYVLTLTFVFELWGLQPIPVNTLPSWFQDKTGQFWGFDLGKQYSDNSEAPTL